MSEEDKVFWERLERRKLGARDTDLANADDIDRHLQSQPFLLYACKRALAWIDGNLQSGVDLPTSMADVRDVLIGAIDSTKIRFED